MVGGSAGGQRRGVAGIEDRAGQVLAFQHDVQDHLKVLVVELRDGLRRIGEGPWVPGEFAVVGVPAVGAEAGAEKDECVAGKPFLAKGARLLQDLFRRAEGSMRLLVAQGPERRHFRISGDLGILPQNSGGLDGGDDKDIERKRILAVGRAEPALWATEIEGAQRRVDEHAPARGADQKLDGHASAVRPEMIATLPAQHLVEIAAAVELGAALAETEEQAVARVEA